MVWFCWPKQYNCFTIGQHIIKYGLHRVTLICFDRYDKRSYVVMDQSDTAAHSLTKSIISLRYSVFFKYVIVIPWIVRLYVGILNPRVLASGLSYVQVDKHGVTILYHLHQCTLGTS